jgi:hypothetical protein
VVNFPVLLDSAHSLFFLHFARSVETNDIDVITDR